MLPFKIILVFFLILGSVFGLSLKPLTSLSEKFLIRSSSSYLVIFNCPNNIYINILLSKALFSKGYRVTIAGPPDDNRNVDRLKGLLFTKMYQISVLFDLECPGSSDFWEFVTQIKPPSEPLGPLLHWLLISEGSVKLNLLNSVPGPNPSLKSDVVYVHALNEKSYKLVEIFRIGYQRPELNQILLADEWNPEISKFPSQTTRNDLLNATVKVGVMKGFENWSKRSDYNHRHINTISKKSDVVIDLILKRLNLSKSYVIEHSYGVYDWFHNRSYTGLLKHLHEGEIDICVAMFQRSEYKEIVREVTLNILNFRPRFLFRAQTLSSTENIYTLPFSKGVWCAIAFTLLLISCVLFLSERDQYSLLEIFFICLGLLLDQGTENSPTRVSSRTTFIFLLVKSVFIFNAYSACIIVFLQTPNDKINDLEALLNSPYLLKMEDTETYRFFSLTSMDPWVHKVYKDHIWKYPPKQVFLPMKEGVKEVRSEMVAFHSDIGMYKIVSEIFNEDEKCGLKEVFMFPNYKTTFSLPKYSPLKEVINQNILILWESGMRTQIVHHWNDPFPACYNKDTLFKSVTLQDVGPVFMFLGIGYLLTIFFFLNEFIFRKITLFQNLNHNRVTFRKQ